MNNSKCLLCGSSECKQESTAGFQEFISCERGYKFKVNSDVLLLPEKTLHKISCLIYEHILDNYNRKRYNSYFYSDLERDKENLKEGEFNLFEMLSKFPSNITDRSNRSLLNLSKMYPNLGSVIGCNSLDSVALFVIEEDYITETNGMFDTLVDLGYLNRHNSSNTYTISVNGRLRIEQLKSNVNETQSVFVALAFKRETEPIREAIKKAILTSSYLPLLIDEVEHNNQIVAQILKEIAASKFVVVDVSFSNTGAYYEAGFAHGLGKEVIVCCKKSVFDGEDKEPRPHFDISQKNLVLWIDTNDLAEKLVKRIDQSISKI